MRVHPSLMPFGALTIAGMMVLAGPSHAQSTSSSSQERMRSCNTQASSQNLSGDARKSFMSDCLAGRSGASGSSKSEASGSSENPQQDKMKTCNSDASAQKLTGDARRTFLSNCLKGS